MDPLNSEKIYSLSGKIPVSLNPDWILSTVTAIGSDFLSEYIKKCYVFSGGLAGQMSIALYYFLESHSQICVLIVTTVLRDCQKHHSISIEIMDHFHR